MLKNRTKRVGYDFLIFFYLPGNITTRRKDRSESFGTNSGEDELDLDVQLSTRKKAKVEIST